MFEEPDDDPMDYGYDEDAEYDRRRDEEMEYEHEKKSHEEKLRKESEANRSEIYDKIVKYFKIQLRHDDLPEEWYFKPVESCTEEEKNIILTMCEENKPKIDQKAYQTGNNANTKTYTIKASEVMGLMGLMNRMIKRCEEHSAPKIKPKIMEQEIDLDDWFANDVENFAKEAVKTFKLIEEDGSINTNRVDQIILDLCNKIFQSLYKEVIEAKENEAL